MTFDKAKQREYFDKMHTLGRLMSEDRISSEEVMKKLDALIKKGSEAPSPLKAVVPKMPPVPEPVPGVEAISEAQSEVVNEGSPIPKQVAASPGPPKPPDREVFPSLSERVWDEKHTDTSSLKAPPPAPKSRRVASFPALKKSGSKVPPISDDRSVGAKTERSHGPSLDWIKQNVPNGNAPKLVEREHDVGQRSDAVHITVLGGKTTVREIFGDKIVVDPRLGALLGRHGGLVTTGSVGSTEFTSRKRAPDLVIKAMEETRHKAARPIQGLMIMKEANQAGLLTPNQSYVVVSEEFDIDGQKHLLKCRYEGDVLCVEPIAVADFAKQDLFCLAVRAKFG